MRVAALRVVELICFVGALAFMIPPVSSTPEHYHAAPALVIGGSLLAVSLLAAWWRAAEHWITALLKFATYIVLLWIAYERSYIH
ncbi:MAG TPA: hypothetical protein VGW57_17230 [Chthoniobacterales bacterium]|nr:hypothetical protein [Chthoniobacterales bacterium]